MNDRNARKYGKQENDTLAPRPARLAMVRLKSAKTSVLESFTQSQYTPGQEEDERGRG